MDIDKVRAFLNTKRAVRRAKLDERFLCARKDAEKIISFIIERYNPRRIYQWGSILHREKFCEISDIDIAVEGIESYEVFSKMYSDVEQFSSLPLDLIRIEKIHPIHAESIRTRGKLVYERKK